MWPLDAASQAWSCRSEYFVNLGCELLGKLFCGIKPIAELIDLVV